MAPATPDTPNAPHEPHVRHGEGFCGVCGAALFGKRAGQRYCSGRCRAAASRRTKKARMKLDLQDLVRRASQILNDL